MASSGSIKRSQIPKLCELCKTDIKIKLSAIIMVNVNIIL
jgi:hypothetical protein